MTRARELGKLANTNTLTADNTNNFVGIASTQPTTRLDVVGVVSATSFSGDGSSLTGIAGTANVSTSTLNVIGASTLAGATFSGVVTLQNNLELQDSDIIKLGTGSDLQIYHDGSNSYIQDGGTGHLVIRGEDIFISNAANSETMASFVVDGAVSLYYDNSVKLATKTDGVDITGELQCDSLDVDGAGDITGVLTLHNHLDMQDDDIIKLGTGDDLQIYHDGTNSTITNTTGDLYITDSGGNIYIQSKHGEQSIVAFADGAVDLYYDNSKKLETTSDGITVTGTIDGQTELRTWLFG